MHLVETQGFPPQSPAVIPLSLSHFLGVDFSFLGGKLGDFDFGIHNKYSSHLVSQGLPRWLSGEEPACQCRRRKRHRYDPWVRKTPWRRSWLPTPIFLPGESHGQRSLVGYSTQGHKELGVTEVTSGTHSEPKSKILCGSFRPSGPNAPPTVTQEACLPAAVHLHIRMKWESGSGHWVWRVA